MPVLDASKSVSKVSWETIRVLKANPESVEWPVLLTIHAAASVHTHPGWVIIPSGPAVRTSICSTCSSWKNPAAFRSEMDKSYLGFCLPSTYLPILQPPSPPPQTLKGATDRSVIAVITIAGTFEIWKSIFPIKGRAKWEFWQEHRVWNVSKHQGTYICCGFISGVGWKLPAKPVW
jgi:hypothetical protein